MIMTGISATQSVEGPQGAISWMSTGAQIADFLSNMSTSTPSPETRTAKDENDDKKNLEKEALHDSKVDW